MHRPSLWTSEARAVWAGLGEVEESTLLDLELLLSPAPVRRSVFLEERRSLTRYWSLSCSTAGLSWYWVRLSQGTVLPLGPCQLCDVTRGSECGG